MSGIGHLAAGFAAKPNTPQIPLWALLLAAEFNDLLYMVLSTTGIEPKVEMSMSFTEGVRYSAAAINPFSHGLFMSIIWSLLAVAIGHAVFKQWRAGAFLGAVVFSHWVLDSLMHSNLPLFFADSPLIGIGLENTGPGFVLMTVLDLALVALAVGYFLTNRKKIRSQQKPA